MMEQSMMTKALCRAQEQRGFCKQQPCTGRQQEGMAKVLKGRRKHSHAVPSCARNLLVIAP
jgi:hypothetical protein